VNRFTGQSQDVSTSDYNTLKVTVIITHKLESFTSALTSRCKVADLHNGYAFTMLTLKTLLNESTNKMKRKGNISA
jgi:hypothetical protein